MEKYVEIDLSGFRATPDETALGETWVAALNTTSICFSLIICAIGGYRMLRKKPSGLIMFLAGSAGWLFLELAVLLTPSLNYN